MNTVAYEGDVVLNLYRSATQLIPLTREEWRDDIKWKTQRCVFLMSLRHKRPEQFYGQDIREGYDYDEEMKRILRQSFWHELLSFMNYERELYNIVWYNEYFGDD